MQNSGPGPDDALSVRSELNDELLKLNIAKVKTELAVLEKSTRPEGGIDKAVYLLKGLGAISAGAIGLFLGVATLIYGIKDSDLRSRELTQEIEGKNKDLQGKKEEIELKTVELKELQGAIAKLQLDVAEIDALVGGIPDGAARSELADRLRRLTSSVGKVSIDVQGAVTVPGSSPKTDSMKVLIGQLYSPEPGVRGKAYDGLMRQYGNDADLVSELVSYARAHSSQVDGVYNSLVLLSHIDYSRIPDAARLDVRGFAVEVLRSSENSRLTNRANKLIGRVP